MECNRQGAYFCRDKERIWEDGDHLIGTIVYSLLGIECILCSIFWIRSSRSMKKIIIQMTLFAALLLKLQLFLLFSYASRSSRKTLFILFHFGRLFLFANVCSTVLDWAAICHFGQVQESYELIKTKIGLFSSFFVRATFTFVVFFMVAGTSTLDEFEGKRRSSTFYRVISLCNALVFVVLFAYIVKYVLTIQKMISLVSHLQDVERSKSLHVVYLVSILISLAYFSKSVIITIEVTSSFWTASIFSPVTFHIFMDFMPDAVIYNCLLLLMKNSKSDREIVKSDKSTSPSNYDNSFTTYFSNFNAIGKFSPEEEPVYSYC